MCCILVASNILIVRAFANRRTNRVRQHSWLRLVWRLARTTNGNKKCIIFIFDSFLLLFLLISERYKSIRLILIMLYFFEKLNFPFVFYRKKCLFAKIFAFQTAQSFSKILSFLSYQLLVRHLILIKNVHF